MSEHCEEHCDSDCPGGKVVKRTFGQTVQFQWHGTWGVRWDYECPFCEGAKAERERCVTLLKDAIGFDDPRACSHVRDGIEEAIYILSGESEPRGLDAAERARIVCFLDDLADRADDDGLLGRRDTITKIKHQIQRGEHLEEK